MLNFMLLIVCDDPKEDYMTERRVRERLINEEIMGHEMVTQLVLAKVVVHLGLEDAIKEDLQGAAVFAAEENVSSSGEAETAYSEAPIMQKAVQNATRNFLALLESVKTEPK